LYGGQIQERQEIPFELDQSKQQIGFRIELKEPMTEPVEVKWELSKPGNRAPTGSTVSRPEGRVTKLQSATLPAHQSRFEQLVELRPGDPLGLWNIRVTLGQTVLIDRPFVVFDAAARRARLRRSDAGL
jgi:hypothetical protein